MKLKVRLVQIIFAAALLFSIVVMIYGFVRNAETDEFIARTDEFLATCETKAKTRPISKATKEEELIARVTGFEVGYCCEICQYYVASACVNRMNGWYDGDAVAMVTDGNDEYYQMNPQYVELVEWNDWNYLLHKTEMLKVVREAEKRTADIWYWDNEDTQSEWAELVFYCAEDDMYYYR